MRLMTSTRVLFLAFLSLTAPLARDGGRAGTRVPELAIESYPLPNGLKVVAAPRPDACPG